MLFWYNLSNFKYENEVIQLIINLKDNNKNSYKAPVPYPANVWINCKAALFDHINNCH